MQVGDDLWLGNFVGAQGLSIATTAGANPTEQQNAAGPMGRIAFMNIVPLTLGTANVAPLHALTAATPLPLAAATGTTLGVAPDGSGAPVIVFDVPRAVSFTTTANLSGLTVTVVGFDQYGRKQTQTQAGPNNATTHTLKAFLSVLSVTPSATNVGTMSVGTSDVFGLPWCITDAGYIVHPGWAETLAADAGTFVAADVTTPATASTGDPRGTYLPSSASNGTRRLVLALHLTASQCGSSPTVVSLIGVTPA